MPPAAVPATVLVVDDEVLVAMTMAEHLRAQGCTVLEAFGPDQALSLLAAHPEVEAIITDVRMPGMLGTELARAVRRGRPDIAVVFCTGYAGDAEAGGFNGWPVLAKPFPLDAIGPALAQAREHQAGRS
jgi:CheY-like chemotaxis protein